MNSHTKYCCIFVVIALILGITVFALISTGFIFTDSYGLFFTILIGVSTVLLSALLIGVMMAEKTILFRESFGSCGNMSLIGGIGVILSGLLASLGDECITCLYVALGVALCFFFLVLQLGGIWGLLYNYLSYRRNHYSCQTNCSCNPCSYTAPRPTSYPADDVRSPYNTCQGPRE